MSHPEEQMRAMIAGQAAEWFVAHRSGELTQVQREAFIDWLRASPAHAREYLALTGFVEDLSHVAKGFPTPAESLTARAQAELDTVQPLFRAADEESVRHVMVAPEPSPRRTHSRTHVWAAGGGLAVTVVAVLLLGTWWMYNRADYSTAHAEQRSWRMPDGSTVHLNSGSAIKVKFDASRRQVELIRGQALFQVAKDASRPFWVLAGDAVVKAIGTEFDVYRRPQGTVISVMEGRVAIWRVPEDSSDGASKVMERSGTTAPPEPIAQLDAGQQARISRDSAVVSKKATDVRKTVAWLQRQVVFDHDPLGSAIEEFNRYNEVRLRIDDPSIRAAEISGIFSAYDTESFIRFLERQPGMRVERTENDIIVTAVESQH